MCQGMCGAGGMKGTQPFCAPVKCVRCVAGGQTFVGFTEILIGCMMVLSVYMPHVGFDGEEDYTTEFELARIIMEEGRVTGAKVWRQQGEGCMGAGKGGECLGTYTKKLSVVADTA